jgi:hypothetical protein
LALKAALGKEDTEAVYQLRRVTTVV